MRFEKKTDFYKLSFGECDDIFQTLDNRAIFPHLLITQNPNFYGAVT